MASKVSEFVDLNANWSDSNVLTPEVSIKGYSMRWKVEGLSRVGTAKRGGEM